MSEGIEYYEYLAQDRIRNLYQQVRRRGWVRRLSNYGLEVQPFPSPSIRISAGNTGATESAVTAQLQTLLAHLKKRHPADIGTVDEPRKYIAGTLPMFSYFLPQGFGTQDSDEPELIYYGGSTGATILGLAGPPHNLVGQSSAGGSMHPVSSALPYLVRVLAKEYRIQTRFKNRRYDESTALTFIQYAEEYNRSARQLRNYSFFATLKLDSAKMGWNPRRKRVVLATPLYVAYAD